VLRALVLEVITPNTRAMVSESRALDEAIRALPSGGHGSLEAARSAFKKTLVAWKRSSAFRSGPVAQSNAFVRAMFWPARPKALDEVLFGNDPIDRRLVEGRGVDAKGLFGLEYLLFAGIDRSVGPSWERRCRYAAEVSGNVLAYAERALRLIGDGREYAQVFASAGPESVNQLVAHSVDAIEGLAGRIAKLVRLAGEGEIRPVDVEGYYSALSCEIACALVAGTEALYSGPNGQSVSDLVALASRPTDDRIRRAFATARQALSGLNEPLEHAAKTNPSAMASVASAVKKLELAIKVDLVSALGITLSFTSTDGD
jgi:predicted lipoprotein